MFLLSTAIYAQNNQKMSMWQDSLLTLGNRMFQSPGEADRLDNNFKFVKTLVSALKEPNSYYYKFESINMISIVNSPDDSFRIFSWNLPLQDGSFLYYGSIQHKMAGGKLKLTPLLDKTFEIKDPEQAILKNEVWYGAQYYDIVPLSAGLYALLGWKGHNPEFTQKVIEILHISSDKQVTLGAKLFSDNDSAARVIFSYTSRASMYLKYNKTARQIEFDHLVPAEPKLKGVYKYYGPDLTYNAYEIRNNRLILKEDIEVKNLESTDEENYIDPLKPNKKLKSGL